MAQLLVDASQRPIAGRLQINLNTLPEAAGPFHSAAVVTVGAQAPYDVVLLTGPR